MIQLMFGQELGRVNLLLLCTLIRRLLTSESTSESRSSINPDCRMKLILVDHGFYSFTADRLGLKLQQAFPDWLIRFDCYWPSIRANITSMETEAIGDWFRYID